MKRRRFLLTLGASGASVAAASAAATSSVAAETPAADGKATDGYRETEHVRDYYRTARI